MKTLLTVLSLFLIPVIAEDAVDVTVSIDTPHPGYKLEVMRIDRSKDGGLTAMARVIPPPPDRMYPAVISTAKDTVNIAKPGGFPVVYLLNRPWNWGEDPTVKNEGEYLKRIGPSTPVPFQRK